MEPLHQPAESDGATNRRRPRQLILTSENEPAVANNLDRVDRLERRNMTLEECVRLCIANSSLGEIGAPARVGRHPLLRNDGVSGNRVPVTLKPIDDNRSLDVQVELENLVFEVVQAYWDLHFSYHNLDATRTLFAESHATWKRTKVRSERELQGGDAANEAQARAQYFTSRTRLEKAKNALMHSEQRLLDLIGLPDSFGQVIQPVGTLTKAGIKFDWEEVKEIALKKNPVLLRQRERVRQQEAALLAATQQLLPQMDAVALYRFLGLEDDESGIPANRDESEDGLIGGEFGEWQLGFQYQQPIEFRAELTQLRNQRLQLRRAQKRLEDLELETIHQLSNAIRRKGDQYQTANTQYNTLKAYRDQAKAASTAYRQGGIPLDVVLDASSQKAQAEADYFRAIAQYQLAIAEVDLRTGRLLQSLGFVWEEPNVSSNPEKVLQTTPAYEKVLKSSHRKLSTSQEPVDYRYAKPQTRSAAFVKN